LIKHGAKINQAEKEVATPLYISAQNGHAEVVDLLLRNGANPNKSREDTGASPLFISTQEGHTGVVTLLLGHRADVNQPKKNGFTAVYVAANSHRYDIVTILVAAGATIQNEKLGPVEKFGDADKISAAVAKGRETTAPSDTVVGQESESNLSRNRAQ